MRFYAYLPQILQSEKHLYINLKLFSSHNLDQPVSLLGQKKREHGSARLHTSLLASSASFLEFELASWISCLEWRIVVAQQCRGSSQGRASRLCRRASLRVSPKSLGTSIWPWALAHKDIFVKVSAVINFWAQHFHETHFGTRRRHYNKPREQFGIALLCPWNLTLPAWHKWHPPTHTL